MKKLIGFCLVAMRMKRLVRVVLLSGFLAWSCLAVPISNLPDILHPVTGKLDQGVWRIPGKWQIVEVPEALRGRDYVVIERGPFDKPGMGFKFNLDADAAVYLSFTPRGDAALPVEWTKTQMHLICNDGKGSSDTNRHVDDIYVRVFKAGVVAVPPHYGKNDRVWGPPHMAVVDENVDAAKKLIAEAKAADGRSKPDAVATNESNQTGGRMEEYASLWYQAEAMVRAEQWDELENLAAELRKGGYPRWSGSGQRKLDAAYDGSWLVHEGYSDKQYEAAIEKGTRWVAAEPKSCLARYQLATAYINYGVKARGNGNTSMMTEENRRKFHERLEKAREILTEAQQLDVQDPDLYDALMNVSGDLYEPKSKLDEYFQKAVAMDPLFYKAYFTRTHYLEWGGQPGEWAKFAEECATKTEDRLGWSLYARIVTYMSGTFKYRDMVRDDTYLDRHQVSWPKLKQGFEDIEKLFPDAHGTLNNFCYFACLAGDRETANKLFGRVTAVSKDMWQSETRLQRWRLWADPKTPKEFLEPARQFKTAPYYSSLDEKSTKLPRPFMTLKFSPDGKLLAAGASRDALLWNLETGKMSTLPFEEFYNFLSLAFSPDGRKLAVCGAPYWGKKMPPGIVQLWDIATETKIATLEGASNSIGAVVFTPDGTHLISTGGTTELSEVLEWDLKTGSHTPMNSGTKIYHRRPALSRDGTMLALDANGWISVMDVASGTILHKDKLPAGSEVTGLAFSPDDRDLAYCTHSGCVELMDPRTFKLRPVQFTPHGERVTGIAFTPDGKTLITSSADESIALHDIATGRKLAVLMGHVGFFTPVDISPGGKTLATGGYDGVVKLWNLDAVLKAAKPYSIPAFPPVTWVAETKPMQVPAMPTSIGLAAIDNPMFFAALQPQLDMNDRAESKR